MQLYLPIASTSLLEQLFPRRPEQKNTVVTSSNITSCNIYLLAEASRKPKAVTSEEWHAAPHFVQQAVYKPQGTAQCTDRVL